MDPLVSTKETDYLDEDKPLRGQNYVCLSFISPEDILIDKEVFHFSKFINSFSSQVDMLFTNLKQKYPDDGQLLDVIKENNSHLFDIKELQDQYKFFKGLNNHELETEFLKINDFKTSMRGIKVRGVFDTLKEAQTRAEVLKRMGDKFDIYVAQVGCWCPWSPNPEDLQDQEYAESSLNTLMKKYKENQLSKDELYEKRKQEKLEDAMKDASEKKKVLQAEKEALKAEQALASGGLNNAESVATTTITDVTPIAAVDLDSVPNISTSTFSESAPVPTPTDESIPADEPSS